MSQNAVYQVIFTGHLRSNVQRPVVEANLVRIFKATPQQAAWLLRGVPVVVKSTPDAALAERYVNAMLQAGLICEVHETQPAAAKPAAVAAEEITAEPQQPPLPGFSAEPAATPAAAEPARRIRTPVEARQSREAAAAATPPVPATENPPAAAASSNTGTTPEKTPAPIKPQVIPSFGTVAKASPPGLPVFHLGQEPFTPQVIPSSLPSTDPKNSKKKKNGKSAPPVTAHVTTPELRIPTEPFTPKVISSLPASRSANGDAGSRLKSVLAVLAAVAIGVALATMLFLQKNRAVRPAVTTTPSQDSPSAAPAPAPQPVSELLKGHWLCLDNSFGKMGEIVFTPDGGYHAMTYGNPESPVLSEAVDVQIGGRYTVEGSRILMHITDIPSRIYFGRSTQTDEYANGRVIHVSDAVMSWSFTARGYTEVSGCMRAYPPYGRDW